MGGEGKSAPGEAGATAAADSHETLVRDMIPYQVFPRDVTDEEFQQLVSQLKLGWYQCLCTTGVTTCATRRREVRKGSAWDQG